MDDLISRQWLMECVNEGWIKFDTEKDENRFIHLVRDIAPSAQPEERTNKRTETHACDCISRKAAIDELDKGAWGVEWDKTLAKTMIESLPSAQPTQNTRVNSNNSLDTISREAAIDAIDEINAEVEDGYGFDYAKWRVHFRVLPSAQPEPNLLEVIKCEDCKYIEYDVSEENTPYGFTNSTKVFGCRKIREIMGDWYDVYLDDFCSRAERREENE